MQIPILINHLGIVPGHPLQGCKHCLFNLGGVVTLFKGVFNLGMPVSIGNGILFGGFPKQWKTKAPILGPSKFLMCPGTLPLHGAILSAAPISRGCLGWAPRGFHLLARASIDLSIQCTCGAALFLFSILVGRVKLLHSGLSSWVPSKARRCAKAGSSKFISLNCYCTKNQSARLVIPCPRCNLWGVVGWAFVTGAIAKVFR